MYYTPCQLHRIVCIDSPRPRHLPLVRRIFKSHRARYPQHSKAYPGPRIRNICPEQASSVKPVQSLPSNGVLWDNAGVAALGRSVWVDDMSVGFGAFLLHYYAQLTQLVKAIQ